MINYERLEQITGMDIKDALSLLNQAINANQHITIGYVVLSYTYHQYDMLCPKAIVYIGDIAMLHAVKEGCTLPRQFFVSHIQWIELM